MTRIRALVKSAPVAIALATFLGFALLSASDAWRRLEYLGYDLLLASSAPGQSSLPITIVRIDEPSFAQIGKQWPWPRRMHGELLEQLNRAGALVVAFDMVLSEPSNPEDDGLFADQIRKAGNVVLAADMVYLENKYVRQRMRVDPIDAFKAAGAASGLANVERDGDLVVRRMTDGRDVFWREIVRRALKVHPGLVEEPAIQTGKMIGYVGPDHTFPYVHYYQALHADTDLPPDAFRDQIVIVGRDVKSSTELDGAEDNFATPFTGTTGWLTPGAEIHANMLESALGKRSFTPLPWEWNLALLLATVTLATLLMRHWRPIVSGAIGVALMAAIAAADWALFAYQGLWLPALASMAGVATVYAALGGHGYLSEQRAHRETRRAFSMYLAPEVVDQIMAHPERLVLGGERREITLLFTDLAGFTTLSEMLGAEQVAQLLNEHFSRATAIIKRHGGTVNRFIGDAIMAFWGAPLANDRQAASACLAARDMQADMRVLREELAARGLPSLHMRVGIHSGPAVVGNLGSADRFDYTAIGDAVNLAARLEGVNKFYGTEILISSDTARQIGAELPLRHVDRVIVKGKTAAVDVFTVCTDAALNEATATAFDAYREMRWDDAERLFRAILDTHPGDRLAGIYIDRIAAYRVEPPAAALDGGIALEKL